MSGFVWFFLFTFGAFEFDTFILVYRLYYTGTYSLVCFLILMTDFFILKDSVINKSTIKGAVLWGLWIMFWIGLSNYFLTTLWYQWEEFSYDNLVKNQLYTLSIGVIFTPFFVVLNNVLTLRKGMSEITQKVNQIDQSGAGQNRDELITIYSRYKEGKFITGLSKLLYIQSCDNYVDVCYKNERILEHKLVRNTLAAVEQDITHPALMRCHRSYIVNIREVKSLIRRKSHYHISLKNSPLEIPVSRRYKNTLLKTLQQKVVTRP
jgi:hypothetical protein